MFSIFGKKDKHFFAPAEQQLIVDAVKQAEKVTSGEIRIYVESHCRFVDALHRAAEVFHNLKMEETDQRNAVLVYVAMKDRQLAVFADEGIFQKEGTEFWNSAVKKMLSHFNKERYAEGIANVVHELGETLAVHFPYDEASDKNELPDDIVFGR